MNKLMQAFGFRHACKAFNQQKKISESDISTILEAGRNSPSSFGLEPWHFVVVKNEDLKKQFQTACYNQKQVVSCSHLIIVLYRKAPSFTLQSDYLRQIIARQIDDPTDATAIDIACQSFINFVENGLADGLTVNHWSEMQSYIASTNMVTTAAYLGIDSCILGGFDPQKIEQILEQSIPQFSRNIFAVSLCLTFGYRLNSPRIPKIRRPLEEIITLL